MHVAGLARCREERKMSDDRYYAVRMVWVRDQETWEKYRRLSLAPSLYLIRV